MPLTFKEVREAWLENFLPFLTADATAAAKSRTATSRSGATPETIDMSLGVPPRFRLHFFRGAGGKVEAKVATGFPSPWVTTKSGRQSLRIQPDSLELDYRDEKELWVHLPDGTTLEFSRDFVEQMLKGFDR